MSIVNTQRQSFGASSTSAAAASYTPPANSRVWVWATARGSSAVMPSVTNDLGDTFIAAGAGLDGGACLARLFYLDIGASPAAMVITVSSSGATQCGGDIVDTTGHDVSWTTGNVVYATEANGDPTVTMASFAANSACLTFYARSAGSGLTFPSGYATLLGITTIATNLIIGAAHDLSSPSTSIAWVGGGTDAVAVGIEIKEASSGQTISIGLASETDSSLSIARSKLMAIGLSSSSESSLAISRKKLLTFGLSSEADSSLSIARSKLLPVGLSLSSESAFAISRSKILAFGLSDETDSALSMLHSKSLFIGISSEIDEALAILRSKIKSIGLSTETDEAFTVSNSTQLVVTISQAIETDSAFFISRIKNRSIGLSNEIDLALSVVFVKNYAIGLSSETDLALAVNRIKQILIGVGIETDEALPMIISGGAVARFATQGRPSHSSVYRSPNISTGVRSVN